MVEKWTGVYLLAFAESSKHLFRHPDTLNRTCHWGGPVLKLLWGQDYQNVPSDDIKKLNRITKVHLRPLKMAHVQPDQHHGIAWTTCIWAPNGKHFQTLRGIGRSQAFLMGFWENWSTRHICSLLKCEWLRLPFKGGMQAPGANEQRKKVMLKSPLACSSATIVFSISQRFPLHNTPNHEVNNAAGIKAK